MQGLHLTADLLDCQCDPAWLTDAALLAESHLCVHTWPEQGAVTLDVYVCNFGGDHSDQAQALLATPLELFDPGQLQRQALQRGRLPLSARSTP